MVETIKSVRELRSLASFFINGVIADELRRFNHIEVFASRCLKQRNQVTQQFISKPHNSCNHKK